MRTRTAKSSDQGKAIANARSAFKKNGHRSGLVHSPASKTSLIQRSPACACGGGCPSCKQKEEGIQTKLKIGAPDDKYEQEADRVADQVMRMPQPDVQRQGVDELDVDEEDDQTLRAKAAKGSAPQPTPNLTRQIEDLRGKGQALPKSARDYFEPRFGQDFSKVRLHTDGQAAEAARSIGARAYTRGRNVVFGAGQYAPDADIGKRLLAHELTHTVQQGNSKSINPLSRLKEPKSNVFERLSQATIQRDKESSKPSFPFWGLPVTCKRSSTKESPSGSPAKEKYRVRVCTDTNELFVEDRRPPHRTHFHSLVVTGGEKTPTPKGRFKLKAWEKDYTTPRWKEQSCTKFSEDRFGRNVFGPYIIRFKGGYYIHGTVGPGISPITLNGIAMGNLAGSHGCIRMSNLDLMRLHDGLLGNPVGTELFVTSCGTPPEADLELVPRTTFSLGDEKKLGFEAEFRLFLPTLIKRKLQPFIYSGVGTKGISAGLGTSVDPFTNLSLFLAGKVGIRTEWFQSIDVGGGLEAGWAFGKSRSLRLGIGWEMWQSMLEDKKREHLLNLFVGVRF